MQRLAWCVVVLVFSGGFVLARDLVFDIDGNLVCVEGGIRNHFPAGDCVAKTYIDTIAPSAIVMRENMRHASELNKALATKIDGQTAALNTLSTNINNLLAELQKNNAAYGQSLRSELLNRFSTLPKQLAADEEAYNVIRTRLMKEVDEAMTARGVPRK